MPEFAWASVVAALGVLPRLAFVLTYPTRPISDFRAIVFMAVEMRQRGLAAPMWHWRFINAGVPTFLSLIFAAVPGDPANVARIATALLTGLVPLVPFLVLRGVLSLPLRLVAAVLLALWPGQIVFSGVVAQDNWVLVPVLAGVSLAIRSLRSGRAHPVASALIYACATFIRQEMLVVMLPAVLVATMTGERSRRGFRTLGFAAIAVVLLGAIACQRGKATGRYRLTTDHGAQSIVGSYAPGSRLDWVDPRLFLSTFRSSPIAVVAHEVGARPIFHLVRRSAATLYDGFQVDSGDLWWSLLEPQTQGRPDRARRLAATTAPLLDAWIFLVHAGFVAAVLLGLRSRSKEIAVIVAVLLLKVGIHFLIVSGPRFFVPVVGLEILAIPVGIAAAGKSRSRLVLASIAGLAIVGALWLAWRSAATWALDHDEVLQRTYRFTLLGPASAARLDCRVDAGWVSSLSGNGARLEMPRRRPEAGSMARCRCEIEAAIPPRALAIAIEDGFAPGGEPGRIVQRVIVDDRLALVHDLAAEPGTGWQQVPLSDGTRPARRVTVEIEALQPTESVAWGDAAATNIRVLAPGDIPLADGAPRPAPRQ